MNGPLLLIKRRKRDTTTVIILIMALLVAFLVLAAQYESWTSPVAAIMGFPIALLGAIWLLGDGGSGKCIYPDRYYFIDSLVRQEWYLDCGVRP